MAQTLHADELARALERCDAPIDVLSLDCFDTLIWRTTPEPSDVFCELEAPLSRHARAVAEATARERRLVGEGVGEVTLADIYRCALPQADAAEIDARCAAELAAEHRHCLAFPPCVELIRNARARGLKVVVVSDTYLTETELRALIAAKAGADALALVDQVFCSSAHGYSKTNGLFDIVVRKLGVSPERILHIGDNEEADVRHAERRGLRSLHLVQGDAWLGEQWRLEAAALLLADQELHAKRAALLPHRAQLAEHARTFAQPAERVGYASLGPLMHGFAHWLRDEARALAAGGRRVKLCFLMRDGHLPKLAYEAVREAGDPPAHAVEISRFTAFAASFTNADDVRSYLGMMSSVAKTDVLAQQLLFTPAEIEALTRGRQAERNPLHRLWKDVTKPKNLALVTARSTRVRRRLFDYLRKQVDLQPGEVMMLVDTGAAGTVQNRVQALIAEEFGVQVEGRYLLLRDVPRAHEAKRGFVGPDRHDGRLMESLYGYIAIIEQFCTVSQGSVIGYTEEGEPVRKQASFPAGQVENRAAAQQACLRFIAEAKTAARSEAGRTPRAFELGALAAFVRMVFLPTREEADFFESFAHDMNLGVQDTLPMADLAAAREDLHRIGPMYVNTTMRIHAPSELRRLGLDLALMQLTRRRLELDLRPTDFRTRSVALPVMVARGQQASVAQIEAAPTHDGYFAALAPIGRCEFAIGVLFGQLFEWVQVESVRAMRTRRQFDASTRDEEIDLWPLAVHEGVELAGNGLVRCPNDQAFSYFAPPALRTDENWTLRIVFRPLVMRTAANPGPAIDTPMPASVAATPSAAESVAAPPPETPA